MNATCLVRRGGSAAVSVILLAGALAAPTLAAKAPAPGGGWSAGTAVSAVEQPDPTRGSQLNDVAVNASGLAIAAWDRFSYSGNGGATIGAAIESGGRWSAPFVVSGTTGFSTTPRVAVSPDGALAVSWTCQDPVAQAGAMQRIQVAVRPAGSTTWTTTTLASGPIGGVQGLTLFVPIAFDGAGNLTAAWTIWNGTLHAVQAATLPKGGSWSAPANLEGGFDGLYPALAVNALGTAGIAYSTSPYAAGGGTAVHYVSRAAATGFWSAPATISETMSSSVGYVTSPIVGMDAPGRATVAYLGDGLEAVRQTDAGWTAPTKVISSPVVGASFVSADLAVDGGGNAVAVAAIFDPTIGVDRSSTWVATGTSAGTWATAKRLTDPTVPVDAYAARAATSPDGKLVLVGWIDHYHGVVQAARLDPVSGKWTTSTIGRGTAFSSFQEVFGLDAASSTAARSIWKNAKTGTQTIVADFRS
jgi:hypothetical protein